MYSKQNSHKTITDFDEMKLRKSTKKNMTTENYDEVMHSFTKRECFFSEVDSCETVRHSFNYIDQSKNVIFSEYKSIFSNTYSITITDKIFEINDMNDQFVSKMDINMNNISFTSIPIMLNSQLMDEIKSDLIDLPMTEKTKSYIFGWHIKSMFTDEQLINFMQDVEMDSDGFNKLKHVPVSKLFSLDYYNMFFKLITNKSKNLAFVMKLIIYECLRNKNINAINMMIWLAISIATGNTKFLYKKIMELYDHTLRYGMLSLMHDVQPEIKPEIIDKVLEKCAEEGIIKIKLRAITEEGINATIDDVEFKNLVKPNVIPTIFGKMRVLASPVPKKKYSTIEDLFSHLPDSLEYTEADEWIGDAKLNYIIYKKMYIKTKDVAKCQVLSSRFRSNAFYQNFFQLKYGIDQPRIGDKFESIVSKTDINEASLLKVIDELVEYGLLVEKVREKEIKKLQDILSEKKIETAESKLFVDYIQDFNVLIHKYGISSYFEEKENKMKLVASYDTTTLSIESEFNQLNKKDKKKEIHQKMLGMLQFFKPLFD